MLNLISGFKKVTLAVLQLIYTTEFRFIFIPATLLAIGLLTYLVITKFKN